MEFSGQFFTSPVLPPGNSSGTHWKGGWVDPRTGLVAMEKRNILPCQELNLGHPAHGPSLFRLSYPDSTGSLKTFILYIKLWLHIQGNHDFNTWLNLRIHKNSVFHNHSLQKMVLGFEASISWCWIWVSHGSDCSIVSALQVFRAFSMGYVVVLIDNPLGKVCGVLKRTVCSGW
jgi:hypothetical protein